MISSKYGIQLGSFIVENVSVPPEVEAAIDKKSSMAAIGNLNDFVKYQMAKGMETARRRRRRRHGHGAGRRLRHRAADHAAAQHGQPAGARRRARGGRRRGSRCRRGAAPGLPDLLAPADVAKAIGVPEADVMTIIESGELGAKKIGRATG